jgi:hypothetical protein
MAVNVVVIKLYFDATAKPAFDQRADARGNKSEIIPNRVVCPNAIVTAPIAKLNAVNARSPYNQKLALWIFDNLIRRNNKPQLLALTPHTTRELLRGEIIRTAVVTESFGNLHARE